MRPTFSLRIASVLPRLALLALCAAAGSVSAQVAWPSKAVRIIVPYAPGGTSDAAARMLADRLRLGQPVIIENRAGAGGVSGIDLLAKAPPDGHTLAFAAISPITLFPHLQHVPYDPLKDVVPVARVMFSPVYVVATPAFTGKTFADAIEQARAQPGKVTVATSGMGSVGHLMLEQISRRAKVRFNHIPYKGGGQVTNDAAGGQFDLFTANPSPAVNALIAQGKLRILAVAAPKRLASLPGIATLEELGFADANLSSVFGVFAPARTPAEILVRLNAEINQLLADKDIQERLARLDNVVSPGSIDQFTTQIRRESEANAKVVREANITME
jgi:tripartite-type tricarboxylate transporter receptor subunit TctC